MVNDDNIYIHSHNSYASLKTICSLCDLKFVINDNWKKHLMFHHRVDADTDRMQKDCRVCGKIYIEQCYIIESTE